MSIKETSKVRIDKWLWAVRLFKTRTLATESCNAGKVKINEISVKASRQVNEDEIIYITKKGIQKIVKVQRIIEKRVAAKLAQECYEDLSPPPAEDLKMPSNFYSFPNREKGEGRPTKRERRKLDRFKGDSD